MLSELNNEEIVSERCFSCSRIFMVEEVTSGLLRPIVSNNKVYYFCAKCVEDSLQCSVLMLLISRIKS